MKVGDLVHMPGKAGLDLTIGIVVESPFVGPNGEKQQTPRVGVLWSDGGDVIDWEPAAWLEVINEDR